MFSLSSLLSRSSWPFMFVFLFFYIKTYIISRFVFDLSLSSQLEEIIMLLHPFVAGLMLYTISLYISKSKIQTFKRFAILSFIASFVLYLNVVYYRFFNDYITMPVLFQFKNFGDLGGSALGLMGPWDPLLFMDYVILLVLAYRKKLAFESVELSKGLKRKAVTAVVGLTILNVGLAEIERPQLLTRIFDRAMVVKYLGIYNYHMLDVFVTSKSSAQRAFAEGSDIIEVENYVNQQPSEENSFTGIAKGKNVVLVSVESFQNFLIDYKVNGQEVTPFLNELKHSSFYFNNFYHQTGQGKTSDAEFLIDNSLYPLSRGAVFTTHAQNEYYALPEFLKENGYTTAALHGNNKSFWNRDIMYKSLGYDYYFDEVFYDVSDENSINYGLMDKPFFEQSMPILKNLQQPFHAKFLMLTHHYPYLLNEEDATIEPLTTGDGSVDRYVQTARYADESLELFFELMKQEGLYENSIFILYGDHYGISENHKRAMSEVIGKEVTSYEQLQLQRVPLFIHIPGMQGGTMDTVSGQIDLKPTILNLLGIKPELDIQFGRDLFDPTRREFTVLRDGSFITNDLVYTEETCYDRQTGFILDSSLCEPIKEQAEQELFLSDKVIQSDLLRFLETVNQ